MLLGQTWPIVRIKQVESAFIISIDVVTVNYHRLQLLCVLLWLFKCYGGSSLRDNKRGSTTSPKRNPRPDVLGKCCFNLTSFLISCLYPACFHQVMFLCWSTTCPPPLYPRFLMYGSAECPHLQSGQVCRWLCRPHWRLWVHFSDTTWGPGPSPFHLFICPLGGWFLISTFDVLGRKEQLDRLSIGSWFPWEKAMLFLDVLLPGKCLHFLFAYSPYFTRECYTHMQLKL